MRPLLREHQRPSQQNNDNSDPLARLRRRCIVGVCLAAAAFIAAFVTDLGRRSPNDDTGVLGVEIAASGVGMVCGTSAVLARAITLAADAKQVDELKWAVRLGEDMADVYQMAPGRRSARR